MKLAIIAVEDDADLKPLEALLPRGYIVSHVIADALLPNDDAVICMHLVPMWTAISARIWRRT